MVTSTKMAEATVGKLLPFVDKYVRGDSGKCSHKEFLNFRRKVGMPAVNSIFNITPQGEIICIMGSRRP
jgi:hypothetical protein